MLKNQKGFIPVILPLFIWVVGMAMTIDGKQIDKNIQESRAKTKIEQTTKTTDQKTSQSSDGRLKYR